MQSLNMGRNTNLRVVVHPGHSFIAACVLIVLFRIAVCHVSFCKEFEVKGKKQSILRLLRISAG